MKHTKVLLASLLVASGFAAQAAHATSGWTGTADYTQALAGTGTVGTFDTYDAAPGVVLLQSTGTTGSGSSQVSTFNGFYQSYVTNHLLAGNVVPSLGLNSTYELTAVASFAESVTAAGAISVTGGNFSIYVDNTTNHNFGADSGFTDGVSILSGNIISGSGVASPSFSFGATDITIQVTSFNAAVYNPATIVGGGGEYSRCA
ncbi:MAG: flocculation-associated PEP-CTERM protein PepA [Hydrogenophilales bacterium]|nr:flocculation-associated PEP-CTERM protein PepA [Hydrogenophilales bacterium]